MAKTLLFQGDSITDCGRATTGGAGYPQVNLGPGYAGLIASRLYCHQPMKWNIFNRGIGGNRSVDLYARWKIDALNLHPDIISILIGVNDTWHRFQSDNGVEVPRYEEFYRRILDWSKRELPEVKFVLLEPFVLPFGFVTSEWADEINLRRQVVRRIADDYHTVFVPLQQQFIDAAKDTGNEYWLVDGVHPTPAGHQLITDQWLQTAASLLD